MKRLFKKLARSLWRISSPIKRPVIRKFDEHMLGLLGNASPRGDTPPNLDLALSSVVRELARLQIQVEVLQQQIDDLPATDRQVSHFNNRLSVVAELG